MDGLSAAASVLAVIEVSMKVASLCSQYSTAVKEAKNDILRQAIYLTCGTAKDESQTLSFPAKYKAIYFVDSADHGRRTATVIFFGFDLCS